MFRPTFSAVFVSLILFFTVSCDSDDQGDDSQPTVKAPVRSDCVVRVTAEARNETEMRLVGQWCDWKYEYGIPMVRDGVLWRVNVTSNPNDPVWAYVLPAGRYQYKLVADGSDWRLDPSNPYTAFDKTENIENSLMELPDCSLPRIVEQGDPELSGDMLTVYFQVERPGDGAELAGADVKVWRDFEPLSEDSWQSSFDPETGILRVDVMNCITGKYRVEVTAKSMNGAKTVRSFPVWYEHEPRTWDRMVMYFAFTDRFCNGNPSNDAPVEGLDDIVNWNGGDWRGIRDKIAEGYFDDLGVSAIWISTPHDNPDGALPGDCGQYFTGYHAYWPQGERKLENHFGTEEDLKDLVKTAHSKGIRVVVDWPANHVYLDNPIHRQYLGNPFWFNYPASTNPDDFWRNKCGELGWNEYALTCWFTEYLPDLNHRNQQLVDRLIDDALWWVRKYDLDGFRVDATKHIRSNYLKLLRKAMDSRVGSKWAPFYMVGENFYYDYGVIGEKISSHELPGQFDFPLFGTVRGVFLAQDVDFSVLDSFIHDTLLDGRNPIPGLDWGSEGEVEAMTPLLGTFLGNHDVERFISLAAGQATGNGCQVFDDGPPPQPSWQDFREAYERMASAFVFLMTVRGLPVIYYGDEIALAGVRDPDNRRPMDFNESHWNDGQRLVNGELKKITALRNAHRALSVGSFTTLAVDSDCYAYLKRYGDDLAIVVLGGNGAGHNLELDAPDGISQWCDAMDSSDSCITAAGGRLTVRCDSWDRKVYLPAHE